MQDITQKQLIESLQQLKEIKPRKEWAVLLKSQILSEKQSDKNTAGQTAEFAGLQGIFSFVSSQKKLTYSLVAFLVLAIGTVGLSQYAVPGDSLFPLKRLAEKSEAAITGKPELQNNVAVLVNRIHDLAELTRNGRTGNIPSAISEVSVNAKDLVQNLKSSPVKDSQTIKDLTNSFKALADVPGTDLTANPDVNYVYKTLAEGQIADLQKATLTNSQKTALAQAEDLYGQGKYEKAFEILLTSR